MTEPKGNLSELQRWLSQAPPGTLVPTELVAQVLAAAASDPGQPPRVLTPTWRERIWTCDPQTRIGVLELAEAVGRTKSWVYRGTGERAKGPRIPHRLLQGELVFVVADIRAWLLEREVVVVPGHPMDLAVRRHSAPIPPPQRRRRGFSG